MPGTKTITASLFLAAATLSLAATPDYFPLQPGNSWAFRGAARWFNSTPQSIEVQGKERLRDQEYSKVNFFGRTIYLRSTDTGLSVFDTAAGQEQSWIRFDAADGQSFPVAIEPCTRAAKIESKMAKVKTPAGEWDNAIQLSFETSCADAGLTSMYFVPGLGPVVYETTSIAGPVRWELIYSRAGSTAAEAPEVAFTVALDAPVYQAAESLNILVRLTLRNTHSQPVTLTFPSGQRYDVRIWNDRGQVVYTWSADKLFPQVFTMEKVGPSEKTFPFVATVPNLPPGRYVAEAWLATGNREYVGIIGFEVIR
jgi:hypothetical protein